MWKGQDLNTCNVLVISIVMTIFECLKRESINTDLYNMCTFFAVESLLCVLHNKNNCLNIKRSAVLKRMQASF